MVLARTTTCTAVWSQPPRQVHAGLTVRDFTYTEAQFHHTVSSAILLAKLPAHCLITDFFISGAASGNTTGSAEIQANGTHLGGSFSVAAIATRLSMTGSPLKISLSDDAANQYAVLRLMVTTASTASVTLSLTGWISYLCGSQET